MSIILYRVDERLIHGQVVVGWGAMLHPDHIVVVDDELAESAWEQDLYTLGLPPGIRAEFTAVDEARPRLEEWRSGSGRIMLLTRTVHAMRRLGRDGGLRDARVNIGGIHYAPGRERVLPYVFLNDEERGELRELAADGAHITAQDLPGARKVDLEQLLGDGGA